MKVYFCEKPSQAKELATYVGARTRGTGCYTGEGVVVTHGIGHLLAQAKPEHYNPALASWDIQLLPVMPSPWVMQIKPDVRAQYQVVARWLKQATEVVIATDADREGEVIAREVMTQVGYRGPVSRLWLSAMDAASVRKALAHLLPGARTQPLYVAGLGRARADWLAGMNVTMALTKAFGTGGKGGTLHFGRVQTPVLALAVRRERAIRAFVPTTYYELQATFELAGTAVPMAWLAAPALLDQDGHALDAAAVRAVAERVRGQPGRIDQVETTPERQRPPLLYSLGSLQREASAKFGLKAQAVLDACQALYEKHKATTYPRTDCEYLPTSMFGEAPAVLAALATIDPLLAPLTAMAHCEAPSPAFNDRKITAHHAIIPTAHTRVALADLSKVERIVYDMIRRRYVAQFLGDFAYLKTVIEVACAGERFRVTGKTPTAEGWRAAYPKESAQAGEDASDAAESELPLPAVQTGQPTRNVRCEVAKKQTKPPRRYTEGTLLGAMESIDKEIVDERLKKIMRSKEKAGIGTDATRAAIIENLFKRAYIVAEKKQIQPTEKGEALIGLLERIAPELADPVLTAEWEDKLMQIEAGSYRLAQFEAEIGTWLCALIERIKAQAAYGATRIGQASASVPAAGPAVACPSCGQPMRRITGAKGAFWGCTGYADGCRTTLPDVDGQPGQRAAAAPANPLYRCAQCHKPLRRVVGPRGAFWGCTGYADGCRYTLPDSNGQPGVASRDMSAKASAAERQAVPAAAAPAPGKAGEACPACGKGHLVQRFMKDSAKPFVGCTAFPTCRYFKWA